MHFQKYFIKLRKNFFNKFRLLLKSFFRKLVIVKLLIDASKRLFFDRFFEEASIIGEHQIDGGVYFSTQCFKF